MDVYIFVSYIYFSHVFSTCLNYILESWIIIQQFEASPHPNMHQFVHVLDAPSGLKDAVTNLHLQADTYSLILEVCNVCMGLWVS